MYYTCNTSFTSTNGHIYQFGEVVTSYDFNRLPIQEQINFTEHYEEISTAIDNTSEDNDSNVSSLEDGTQNEEDNSSHSNDFGGFDGGDTGGGGASGDF